MRLAGRKAPDMVDDLWAAMLKAAPPSPVTELEVMLAEVLEQARLGLVWFQDMCPQFTDGSDDEMNARIHEALAAYEAKKEGK